MTDREVTAVATAFRGLAAVSERMMVLARRLRQQPGVTQAAYSCQIRAEDPVSDYMVRVGQGEGYCFEWFVDAEFSDGVGLNLTIDITANGSAWSIGGSAAANTADGQVDLLRLPPSRAESASEIAQALLDMADELDRRREDILRLRATRA